MSCGYIGEIIISWFRGDPEIIKIQCANEEKHVGGHLIVVPREVKK